MLPVRGTVRRRAPEETLGTHILKVKQTKQKYFVMHQKTEKKKPTTVEPYLDKSQLFKQSKNTEASKSFEYKVHEVNTGTDPSIFSELDKIEVFIQPLERSHRIEIDAEKPSLSRIREKCIDLVNFEYRTIITPQSEKLRFITKAGNSVISISKEEEEIEIKEFIVSSKLFTSFVNQCFSVSLVPASQLDYFYFARLKTQKLVNSLESCRYDFYAACFYFTDKPKGIKRCGELSIIGKEMMITDVEIQGSGSDGSSYRQRLDYMTDLPKAEYSQDKESPFVTVLMQSQTDFPCFQLLPSDFYHLLMTTKKSRLTLKIEVIEPEVARKMFLRAIATKIPWTAGYNLVNASYQPVLIERGQQLPAEIKFDQESGCIISKVQGRSEEKYAFYELLGFVFQSFGGMATPVRTDVVTFSIWFKGQQLPSTFGLSNESFDLRAKSASNFYKDLLSFIGGNSSKWAGTNPYISDNCFKFDMRNNQGKGMLIELNMNPKDRKDTKIIVRDGSVEFLNFRKPSVFL